jgi:hypothetical protein
VLSYPSFVHLTVLIVLGAHGLRVLGRLGLYMGEAQPLDYKYVLMSFDLIEEPF